MEQQLILDRYRPLEELARGGFGEVLLAYDTRMQRRVAIKRLPFPIDLTGHAVAPAGLAEARTAAMLSHPSIVTVHEWDTDADEAFIIMEYVAGASLARLLDEFGPLDLEEAASVLRDVAAAVEHAHDNGVLHLDLKPENVLVAPDGRAKVTDFGVATLSTSAGHGPTMGGTLGYMPLEQLRGDRVDERTDVWAVGALTFEILADANPFVADTIEGAVFKAEIVEPPAPSEFDESLPPAVDAVILSALATHPSDRYGSVGEFVEHLSACLGDPDTGRISLAGKVTELAGEDASAREPASALGLWDRFVPWEGVASRAVATAVAGWLAWLGTSVFSFESFATWSVVAFIAVIAALAPALGALAGIVLFIVGVAVAGFVPLALALGLATAVVWWFAGRMSGGGFAGTLASPVLSTAHAGPALPLLLGFALRPLVATLLGGYAAALGLVASAASGGLAPYTVVDWRFLLDPLGTKLVASGVRSLVATPAPLLVIAGWAVAALAMSLASARATRLAALVGSVLGTTAMVGAYAAADAVALRFGPTTAWSGIAIAPDIAGSLILVVLVIAAGPPTRAEEE